MDRGEYKIRGRNWHRRRLLRVGIACVGGLAATSLVLGWAKNPVSAPGLNVSRTVIAQPSPPPTAVNYGLPVRLKIPRLAVDAPIAYMGLTKTGNMATPTAITDVGWYKHGSLPGNKGSAVLAGHVNGLKGQPGVFTSLDKLQKGDTLQVIDSNRTVISFTVKETRIYSEDAQPSEVFDASGAAHLNLITCSGAWDKATRHFLERLVVFTDKSS